METNGITIPDAGTTTQFIPDPIGGWVYEVTTITQVQQHNLDDVKIKLSLAQDNLAAAQAAVDALAPVAASFEVAVTALPVEVTPISTPPSLQ